MVKVRAVIVVKVKGSTILEVVISMVVIIFVIGVALMILSNVTRLSLSARKLKTDAILQSQLSVISLDENIEDTTFTVGDFNLEKRVKKSEFGDHLYNVHLKAIDKNAVTISEIKGIVFNHHDQ